MLRKLLLAFLMVAALGGCSGGGSGSSSTATGDPVILPAQTVEQPQPVASDWHIGPWLGLINYSTNLPLYLTKDEAGNPYFDFGPGQSPHYVTRSVTPSDPPLADTAFLHLQFRIDGPSDAIIYGNGCDPSKPSTVSLYFSWPTTENTPMPPKEDRVNWSQDGYRWWAEFARSAPLQVGKTYDVKAPLNAASNWRTVISYRTSNSVTHPDWFARDKSHVGRLGFTFSNCSGAGHGATATKPVRFTLLEFRVE